MAGNSASGDQKKQIKSVTSVGPTTSFREEALKNALDQTAFKRGKKPGFGLPVNWSHTLPHASWIGFLILACCVSNTIEASALGAPLPLGKLGMVSGVARPAAWGSPFGETWLLSEFCFF